MAVAREMVSESELVERVLAREPSAFAELVTRYQGPVLGAALSVTGDLELAQDVAQETFVVLWRNPDRLREPGRIAAFLLGVARNLARSACRRQARRTALSVPRISEIASVAGGAENPTPHEELARREDLAFLRSCLDQVPPPHREALVLFYLEDLSVDEVARLTGASAALVRQRLARGRRALKVGLLQRLGDVLQAVRPGPAFTAGVVAWATGMREASAAGVVANAGVAIVAKKTTVIMMMGAILVGALGWIAVQPGSRAEPETTSPGSDSPAPRLQETEPKAEVAAAGVAMPASPEVEVRRLTDPATRTDMLARLRSRRTNRSAPSDERAAQTQPLEEAPTLPREYVRDSVREIGPLLSECYEAALERAPDLSGRLMMTFTIEGDPDVGAVIGESEIDETRSTIADQDLRECVRETMFAIEIDPPEAGGIVNVTYPFEFYPTLEEVQKHMRYPVTFRE